MFPRVYRALALLFSYSEERDAREPSLFLFLYLDADFLFAFYGKRDAS